MLGREIESRDAIKNMNMMTNGYKNKTRILDEHTNVYLYEEQYEDHHWRLDLMSKQLVLDSRLGGFGVESTPK